MVNQRAPLFERSEESYPCRHSYGTLSGTEAFQISQLKWERSLSPRVNHTSVTNSSFPIGQVSYSSPTSIGRETQAIVTPLRNSYEFCSFEKPVWLW
ncbi:hypothetical protein TNCV_914671 [Trichonephila clavipes]|uniref:Uncharacterized protein n=1 Tax=Trichonephila clavipes TaxID=2585209 RepID=A0A8X6RI04_TRICX|nr:hypothetical protein TNCV_914671 [Trichonephila clavipes]